MIQNISKRNYQTTKYLKDTNYIKLQSTNCKLIQTTNSNFYLRVASSSSENDALTLAVVTSDRSARWRPYHHVALADLAVPAQVGGPYNWLQDFWKMLSKMRRYNLISDISNSLEDVVQELWKLDVQKMMQHILFTERMYMNVPYTIHTSCVDISKLFVHQPAGCIPSFDFFRRNLSPILQEGGHQILAAPGRVWVGHLKDLKPEKGSKRCVFIFSIRKGSMKCLFILFVFFMCMVLKICYFKLARSSIAAHPDDGWSASNQHHLTQSKPKQLLGGGSNGYETLAEHQQCNLTHAMLFKTSWHLKDSNYFLRKFEAPGLNAATHLANAFYVFVKYQWPTLANQALHGSCTRI